MSFSFEVSNQPRRVLVSVRVTIHTTPSKLAGEGHITTRSFCNNILGVLGATHSYRSDEPFVAPVKILMTTIIQPIRKPLFIFYRRVMTLPCVIVCHIASSGLSLILLLLKRIFKALDFLGGLALGFAPIMLLIYIEIFTNLMLDSLIQIFISTILVIGGSVFAFVKRKNAMGAGILVGFFGGFALGFVLVMLFLFLALSAIP